jgi:hypothetical protein
MNLKQNCEVEREKARRVGGPNVRRFQDASKDVSADAKAVLNHAFRLGLLLILILAAPLMAAGLIYRALALRLARNRAPKPTPDS